MNKLKLLIVAILAACALLPIAATTAQAQHISVEVGDRPYYSHGPYYVEHGHRMEWVPGHWTNHHHTWVHGHYIRHGHAEHVDHVRVY